MTGEAPHSPRLTIAIPTVNRARLLGRAVESALSQTYPHLEIIVSNNGSTDDTRAVLARYQSPRLRVVHRDETVPAAAHGNFLLEEARGEFFLGLSDDDWLEPRFGERVMDLFDGHPDLSFVWTGCWMHYGDVAMPARVGPSVESGSSFLASFLAGERNVCWCACVTRTSDLRRLGPIPEGVICGDMFYWTKLAGLGSVGCVAEPVAHYLCYRDDGDGMAGGAPVVAWASETQRWASDILAVCDRDTQPGLDTGCVRQDAVRFVARSTANQFLWNALRGVRRRELWRSLRPCFEFLRGGGFGPMLRVVSSLLAPRFLIKRAILVMARRQRSAFYGPDSQ
jgi:glycosyltransferase involved in cell wall biosynthesis